MVVAIEFEQDVTGAGIFDIVISKFSYWQQFYPIILFSIDKCFEVCFYCIIFPVRLAIRL